MMKATLLALLFLLLFLSGCATPKYACGVPDGIGCKPLSEVHRMARDGTLKMKSAPNNLAEESKPKVQAEVTSTAESEVDLVESRLTADVITVTPGAPILIPPRTLRVWVARWPDEDGTLHDETYLYLKLDSGHWLVE